jgi:hypothetical protein
MTLHMPHMHLPHAVHVPASYSLTGIILGVVALPVLILGSLFMIVRAVVGN